ncbi:MAG: lysylphosphatidylglycerol synthase transmembrane domain-containing protein [Deltaproteobacteria bacterium]|nr:lysylphosphatidylglycerol synthase transmembrane domain-containing protein [Deltaproteobacteria bacterium]
MLIGWLLSSGKLDLRALGRVFGDPVLFVGNMLCWTLCALVIAAARWRLLLRGLGIHLRFSTAIRLQFIALFANTAVPGNVAGDVLKNVLAARELPALTLTRTLTCVLLERVVGLIALVAISVIAVSLRFSEVYARAPSLVLFSYLLGLGTLGGVVVALVAAKLATRARAQADETAATAPTFVSKIRDRIADVGDALFTIAKRPAILGGAIGLSLAMHLLYVALFVALGQKITPTQLPILDVCVVYPIGMLTSILPLAPGGIGVGHAAFSALFALFGATGGADIFNVFLVGQLVPNLVGVVPYLLDSGARTPTKSQ